MKKFENILFPTLISALAMTVAVACAPKSDTDSVNARRGQACDNKTIMCDAGQMGERFAKVGQDTLLEDLKKELLAEKDGNQRQLNQKEATKLSRIGLGLQDTKVTVTVVDEKNTSTVLSGELKDKAADLSSADGLIKGRLACVDKDGKCLTARIDLSKTMTVKDNVITAKMVSGRNINGNMTEAEKNMTAQIKAIVRDLNADVLTADQDVLSKSEAFKKLFNLIIAKVKGSHDANSVKSVLVQTSEIANGKTALSALIVSNENEVIGFDGLLRLVAKGTDDKTSQEFKKVVNQDLLKRAALSGDTKTTISDSIKTITLTTASVGQFGFKMDVQGANQAIESLNVTMTTADAAISASTAVDAKTAAKTNTTTEVPTDGYLFGEPEIIQQNKDKAQKTDSSSDQDPNKKTE